MKIGHDDTQITKFPSKDCNYPQINQQKYIFNNASIIFEELEKEEDTQDYKNKTLNELLQLLAR